MMCCNMFFKAGLLYYFADLLSIFSLLLLALCLCLCCRMMSAAAKFCFHNFRFWAFFPDCQKAKIGETIDAIRFALKQIYYNGTYTRSQIVRQMVIR